MKNNIIEITYDYRNRNMRFVPLDRDIRGRFLLSRVAEPTAMCWRDRIPEDIPGQILGIDRDKGIGYLTEPIHRDQQLKARLEKQGYRFEDERQEFPGIETAAWLFWFLRVFQDGKVRVLQGELPESVAYDPPNRLAPKPKRGPARLREIFHRHPDVAAQYAGWDAKQREAWEQLVGV